MTKALAKKSVLGSRPKTPKPKDGGKAPEKPLRNYDAKRDIKKFGLVPVEDVVIENPITGEKKTITIRRDGTNDAKLLEALADPNFTREQKDSVVAAWLFERGKENASFLMDIIQYKGQHAKETKVFKAQVRKDVDIMVETFIMFMQDASDRILHGLQFETRTVKDDGKEKKILHRLSKNLPAIEIDNIITTLGDIALYFAQTSELMANKMQEETERREKEIGRGIYVDVRGGAYSIYEDKDIIKRVEADMANKEEE